jgi:hypothetical protein
MTLTPRQRLGTYVLDCLVDVTPRNLATAPDNRRIGVRADMLRALAAELERQFPGALEHTRRNLAARGLALPNQQRPEGAEGVGQW